MEELKNKHTLPKCRDYLNNYLNDTLVLSILATVAVAVPVAAATTEFLEDGKLVYIYDSGIQWNGKWAKCTLQSDVFEKKATACVGECSTSGWVAKTTYTASVKDIGGFTDTAYTRYNYR